MQAVFIAPDIECDGCANSIKKSLGAVDGVESVFVDIPGKRIIVEFDPGKTGQTPLIALLDDIGFPAGIAATDTDGRPV
jgi:copper chaperone